MKKWLIPIVLVAACSGGAPDVLGLSGVISAGLGLQPGILKFYDDAVLIDVPQSATVGNPVMIAVKTYGGGCITRGETRLTQSGLSVEVAPFDKVIDPGPQGACTDDLRIFEHGVVVVFDTPGSANVVIQGREWPKNREFSREYSIAVQ